MRGGQPVQPRAARRAAALEERRVERRRTQSEDYQVRQHRIERIRKAAFGLIAVLVLAGGAYLAFGDFLAPRAAATGDAIGVQASMAGFTPVTIRVKAGEAVTLDFWTRDSAVHLERGVHTLISDELGIRAELPGADAVSESRVAVTFTAPMKAGPYDIYCDTCCGGRDNPTMHGKIVVEA
jgi:plastocyanin